MKKLLITPIVVLLLVIICQAHEFWLEANKYFLKVGESCQIRFMVGENFKGEGWDLKTHRIEKLDLTQASGTTNVMDSVRVNDALVKMTFKEPGTKMLVMQSNNAYIELAADKFNEYLKEDGLDEVYAQREKTKTLDKPSRELYSRHTKLLLSVGDLNDDTFKKVVGLPIEIIPEKNPYTLKKGDKQHFKVLFNGKPLFEGKVRLWNRYDNRTTIQNIYTNTDGTIEMSISTPGRWMISIVKMVPSKDPKADWQSYWGSLVFAVKE
ncbi:MAG: DUF4198 domain-containing protein [Chryseolinea sp.]